MPRISVPAVISSRAVTSATICTVGLLTGALGLAMPNVRAVAAKPGQVIARSASPTQFGRLVTDLRHAPKGSISPTGYRRYLVGLATSAERSASKGSFCTSESTLASLRLALTRYRKTGRRRIRVIPLEAATISADVLDLQAVLLAGRAAASCGGAAPGSTISSPTSGGIFTNYITDYGQDLFVGRIPVPGGGPNPNAAALGELAVIHGYEDSPPVPSSNFYRNVTGTEFFQPCPAIQTDCGRSARPKRPVPPSTRDLTSFLRSSETVGKEAQVAGKTFNRVASDESNYDPGVTITPKTYDDGTSIPNGINWTGSASNITADVNAGTFLLWHSDHGNTNGTGWYEPPFGMTNVEAASPAGAALPVVWSSDCDSGKFDDPTATALPYTVPGNDPSFGELWLESEHAVGFVGASRESPIVADGFLLRGMGTSLFPVADHSQRSHRQLCG